jgi:hypothetical protein
LSSAWIRWRPRKSAESPPPPTCIAVRRAGEGWCDPVRRKLTGTEETWLREWVGEASRRRGRRRGTVTECGWPDLKGSAFFWLIITREVWALTVEV